MIRKHAVTVRFPVVSIAPTNKTCACSHTGLEKSGANTPSRDSNSVGSVSIARPLVATVIFSLYWLPLRFQRAKMAKVELRVVAPGVAAATVGHETKRYDGCTRRN